MPSPRKVKKVVAAKATHAPYKDMVCGAIATLKERGGSSRQAITKFVKANNRVGDNCDTQVKIALRRMVAQKVLKQISGIGASGSFKLTVKPKPAKKPAAKKSSVAAKKPATKKTATRKPAGGAKRKKRVTAKKPAAKKTSPKKTTPKKPIKRTSAKRPGSAKKKSAKKPVARKLAGKRATPKKKTVKKSKK